MSIKDNQPNKSLSKPIDLYEGFFLALSATTLADVMPDYRKQFEIDETLSDHEAGAIVLTRILAAEYEFEVSARRIGAILATFFDEEITSRFSQEVRVILGASGVDAAAFERFKPTQSDLHDAKLMDLDHLAEEAATRGYTCFGNALAPPIRDRLEDLLQVTI